jgi:hypothetical protein
MLTFNSILRNENIDPVGVRLVRHQDTRPGRLTPYNLWRSGDGRFETYQRMQSRNVFAIGDILASFVATPVDETLFVGLFRVNGAGTVPPGAIEPSTQAESDATIFYDTCRDERLSDYIGLLTVSWGLGFRAWVQRAHLKDKQVLEIRLVAQRGAFPRIYQLLLGHRPNHGGAATLARSSEVGEGSLLAHL